LDERFQIRAGAKLEICLQMFADKIFKALVSVMQVIDFLKLNPVCKDLKRFLHEKKQSKPICKKCGALKKAIVKKDVKSKVAAKNGRLIGSSGLHTFFTTWLFWIRFHFFCKCILCS